MEPPERESWQFSDLQASGARALTEGLSSLPTEFTSASTTPLACWNSDCYGFVTFLAGSPVEGNEFEIWTGSYDRRNDEWTPLRGGWFGRSMEREEITGPWEAPFETMESNVLHVGVRVMREDEEEGPALVVSGWCSAPLARLSLVQGKDRVSIPIGHFGSWVIGCQGGDPWAVEAQDHAGTQTGFVDRNVW